MTEASPSSRRSLWQRIRPLRVDLYLLSELAAPFLGGVLFFLFVFMMAQTIRWAEMLIVHGVSGGLLLRMIGYVILTFIPFTLPSAYLVATLFAFGRLSTDNEWVALRSAGFSTKRISVPVLGVGLLLSIAALFLNMEWGPAGERNLYRTLLRIGNTGIATAIKEGTFVSGFFNLLLYADKYDPKTNHLKRVFIFDERDPKQPVTVVAPEGDLIPLKQRSELESAYVMRLQSGNIHRSDPSTEAYSKTDFGEYRLLLRIDAGDAEMPSKPRMIGFQQLQEKIRSPRTSREDRNQLIADYWRRISVSLTPLVFSILGMAFGIIPTRSVRSSAAVVSFTVVLVHYTLTTTLLGSAQQYPAFASLIMLSPDLLLTGLGLFVLRRSTG